MEQQEEHPLVMFPQVQFNFEVPPSHLMLKTITMIKMYIYSYLPLKTGSC